MATPDLGVGIFGYGSLLSCPGPDIGPHIVRRISHFSPWKIEYARGSEGRGGGPTLVIHQAGGSVNGQVLVLDVGANRLAEVRVWLWERENKPKQRCIKEMRLAGLDHVLYCDIEVEHSCRGHQRRVACKVCHRERLFETGKEWHSVSRA